MVLHMALLALGGMYGTDLKVAWISRNVGYLLGLFGLLFCNMSLYIAASVMDPGRFNRQGYYALSPRDLTALTCTHTHTLIHLMPRS